MPGLARLLATGWLGFLAACSGVSHLSSNTPALFCFRLSATPAEPRLLLPGAVRLASTPTTSHFSNLKGFEAQALRPDSIAELASLLWWSTPDSLFLVYEHYFVHIEVRFARLRDSLSGKATYSSDVHRRPETVWSVSGRPTPCPT